MTIKLIPEEIRDYLSYNQDTGELVWIKKPSNNTKIGDLSGGKSGNGYLQIRFKSSPYYNHRIAWFLHTGEQPPDEIDHDDGNPLNNAFENLRASTSSQNQCNQLKDKTNTSGYKGVSLRKNSTKYEAYIKINKKQRHLGYFNTPEEAHQAYREAANELHEGFKNYG